MQPNRIAQPGQLRTGLRKRERIGFDLSAVGAVLSLVYLPIVAILQSLKIASQAIGGAAALAGALLVLALCWPKLTIRTKGDALLPTGVAMPALIALGIVGVVSCLFAQLTFRNDQAVGMWLQYLSALSIALLLPIFLGLSKARNMLRPALLGWTLFALIAIATMLLHLTGLVRGEGSNVRQFGILGDPVAWLMSAFAVIYFEKRSWLMFVLCLGLLSVTGSRAPTVMTAVGLFLSATMRPSRSGYDAARRIVSSGATVLGLIAAPLLMPYVFERLAQTNIVSNDRTPTILFGLDLFLDKPIIGGGYNFHTYYYVKESGLRSGVGGVFVQQVDNWVQILADFGTIGFLAFTIFAGSLLMACVRVARSEPPLIPAGAPMEFYSVTRALACWLIPFILLNHTATYIVPVSLVGAVFFAGAGMVIGVDRQMRTTTILSQRATPRSSAVSIRPV